LIVTASLMALAGLALTLGSCAIGEGNVFGVMILLGFTLLIIGGLVSIVASSMIVPKKIDDYYVWINKVSASYLAALPQAPPGL
jgi:ABC-type transport system involved in multi-copper enzyme maturation permease subunit